MQNAATLIEQIGIGKTAHVPKGKGQIMSSIDPTGCRNAIHIMNVPSSFFESVSLDSHTLTATSDTAKNNVAKLI